MSTRKTEHAARVGLAGLVLFVAGCATPPSAPPPDPVDVFIADQMAASAQSVRELAKTTRGTKHHAGERLPDLEDNKIDEASNAAKPEEVAKSAVNLTAISLRDLAATRNNIRVVDAETGKAFSPESAKALLEKTPVGLENKYTGKYIGELEPLMERLANASGWRIQKATGVRVAPVTVAINAQDRTVYQILRDLGSMVGDSVDIVVSVPDKTLRLRYPDR